MPTDHHHHHNLSAAHHEHLAGLSPHRHHLFDTMAIGEPHHGIDLVTTLRSELAALSYKKDRLSSELHDIKTALCAKETENENLRSQAARQTALISSLQSRIQASETREQSVQQRCDSTIQTIQKEKRAADERCKELLSKLQHLETHVSSEESQKEQIKAQLNDFVRRLAICLGIDVCANAHITPECVLTRAEEVMTQLQHTKAKVVSTCDTLSSCENELLNVKSLANIEKQRLTAQLEGATNHNHELEGRCRQYERDLQIQRDRLTESEISSEKLKEELRGFESRCHRLQNNLDRSQSDRLQFLRCIANQLNLPEPCETLIKDKLRDILSEHQAMHAEIATLRAQLCTGNEKLKETQESSQCRLRTEVAQKCQLEERLEKCHEEIHNLRKDQLGLSEYLQRLARALNWSECSTPPALGNDTNIMAESLLERAERLAAHFENNGHELVPAHSHHHLHHRHDHTPEKGCCDHHHAHLHTKLRRERSCHDISLKESSSLYNLQRRVRILREQVQRRDLHLELLRRKLAIIEDGARGKCVLQTERDEAICRAKKASKQIDKLTAQLVDARAQIAEVKAQLAEAVEYKITALERARKIDELTAQICDLEEEKTRLLAQCSALKERLRSSTESAQERRCRDETMINSLREDLARLQTQLSDANHRLSHLQSFRTSVARTLHLRDLSESDLVHRLQALCSTLQDNLGASKHYESTTSPLGDSNFMHYDEFVPPLSAHCRMTRECSSPPLISPQYHHRSNSAGVGALDLGKNTLNNHAYSHSHAHPHAHGHGHGQGYGHRHGEQHAHRQHNTTEHHRCRSKSKGRGADEKRVHDDCFESDVHRCKDDLLGGGYDDEYSKYC